MTLFRPLRNRSIAYLWGGQVFSAIGDELYDIALVWVAAGLIGEKTGYLMAVKATSILIFSLFGGIWADRWDHRRTMVFVDVVRGVTLLLIPLSAIFGTVTLWILILVTIIVSSLEAFFDPALRASLPRLTENKELLQSTNALMETTSRFAKIIGPGLVGILSRFIPVIHYFTIDALSFFASAFSIQKLKKSLPAEKGTAIEGWKGVKEGIIGGFNLSQSRALIHFIIVTDAIVNSSWFFVFPLSVGLLLHERMPDKISALSLLVAAYGIGNLSANLLMGTIRIRRYERCLFLGRLIVALGFILIALSPNLTWMMVSAGIAALGGPMVDISKLTLIQNTFSSRETAKVYRFSLSATYSALLLALLISPKLFSLFPIPHLIVAAGALMGSMGILGFLLFWKK